MPTVTVKMSKELFARLEKMAHELRLPKAQIMRDSFERAGGRAVPGSVYEAIADLVGSVQGPGDLLSNPKHMEDFGKDQPRRRTKGQRRSRAKR